MNLLPLAWALFVTAAPARSINGGSPELRSALYATGQGDSLWDTAELWIESNGLVVYVSKSPHSCAKVVLEAARRDPDFWMHTLRILNEGLPRNARQRALVLRQSIFMIKQAPAGLSCGWRLLEPGSDWESVMLMKANRTLGSCEEAVDALAKLGVNSTVAQEVKATLQRPRSLSECK